MVGFELETKILGILYEKWWHDTVTGCAQQTICETVNAEENRVGQALQILENQCYVERYYQWYKITAPLGIEAYEEVLSPSSLAKKEEQRQKILTFLEPYYDRDINALISHDELAAAVGIEDFDELYSQMTYLESKEYVTLEVSMGENFWARLLAPGKLKLSSYEPQNYQSMTNAYRSLFIVENHLRKFIETKLADHYDTDWWKKGISGALRNLADKRKRDEQQRGWQVSITKSNLEYLSFTHLSKIIINNWSDIFEPIFRDQSKIALPLKELEDIRNAIAHARTLTDDAMNRLEQYCGDISNLTK